MYSMQDYKAVIRWIMASGPITSREIDGETVETVADYLFRFQNHCRRLTAAMKLKDTCSLEENL